MLAGLPVKVLYQVEVRCGVSYREQVGDMGYADYYDACDAASRLARWLERGHLHELPEAAIDLRSDLAEMGFDPRAAAVWVVRLREVRPGVWDTAGEDMRRAVDCTPGGDDEDDLPDTVIEVVVGVNCG